jgi:hypothetical protein
MIALIRSQETRPDDYKLLDHNTSWEIKAVATRNTPETRGKGLASRCIAALQQRVFDLYPMAGKGCLLWIITSEAQNGPYWRRRGFEVVLSEIKPKGFWGSYEPFTFLTLVKRVEAA